MSQHVPDRPLEGLSSPSSLPTLPITITHSTLVRQAPSLVTGDEQNQCCWQGRHELQAWRIESLPTLYHALPPQLLCTCNMHMHICMCICAYPCARMCELVTNACPFGYYST